MQNTNYININISPK